MGVHACAASTWKTCDKAFIAHFCRRVCLSAQRCHDALHQSSLSQLCAGTNHQVGMLTLSVLTPSTSTHKHTNTHSIYKPRSSLINVLTARYDCTPAALKRALVASTSCQPVTVRKRVQKRVSAPQKCRATTAGFQNPAA